MATRTYNVLVRKLPQVLNSRQTRAFVREIQDSMDSEGPRVVLDCSEVRELNRPVVDTLLRCLEEAMKRNGDVRVAALPSGSEAVLSLAAADSLFQIFRTPIEAVNSFEMSSLSATPRKTAPVEIPTKSRGAT